MRLLLDAHTLLWWLGGDGQLSGPARSAIETAREPMIGAGTLIEIAVKRSLGKLEIGEDWPEQARADGFEVLDVSWRHAAALQALPFLTVAGRAHRDPFDRLLIAQALAEAVPIVGRDGALGAYGVSLIW